MPLSDWLKAGPQAGQAALALARSFDSEGQIREEADGIVLPANIVARLDEADAFALGLPPATALTLQLNSSGSLAAGSIQVNVKWVRRGGLPVRPDITGARVREGGRVGRIGDPPNTRHIELAVGEAQSLVETVEKAIDAGISCMDITDVSVSKALLWHSVEIRTRSRVETLTGLSADSARGLNHDLRVFVNHHLSDLIGKDRKQLQIVDDAITGIVRARRQYLAQSDISRAIASVPGNASAALAHPLFNYGHMPAEMRSSLPASFSILTDPSQRQRYNDDFVAHEMQAFESFFDDLGGLIPSISNMSAGPRPKTRTEATDGSIRTSTTPPRIRSTNTSPSMPMEPHPSLTT